MFATDLQLATLFLKFSRDKLLGQYWPRLRQCVESLTDEQMWWRPNSASNSIGNLILHVNGNVTQWLVDSFNCGEVKRNRPAEQGKRIWILRTQVSGRKVDSGGIGQLLVAEIHAFEGNVRANNTVRSQIQTASGFFCSSDVKEIPNAFALPSGVCC